MALHSTVISDFATSISGEVFLPGQQEYDSITHDRWNFFTCKCKPALIVRPKTVEDIQATVLFGKQVKKHVVPRNGSHSFKSQQDDIIVVDMCHFKKVTLDKETGIVVAGGGVNLGDLDNATAPWHVPIGVFPDTGALGLGLHGGFGFQDRLHGYTVDNILSAKIVTADGKHVTASERENPDLLWAIKGAGSSFGIITEVELQSYRIDRVWHGMVGLPFNKESLDLLFDVGEAHHSDTNMAYYVVSGNTPDGASKLAIALMIYYGSKEEAEQLFSPILEKNPVVIVPPKDKTFLEVQKSLTTVFPQAYWYFTGGPLPENRATEDWRTKLLAEWNSMPTSYLAGIVVEMRGGKGSKIPVTSTAAPSDRNRKYDLVICTGTSDPNQVDELTRHVRRARDNLGIVGKSQRLPAFNTSTDFHFSVREAYGCNAERLVAIKEKYDPDNFFEGMTNILPHKKYFSQ